MLLRNEAIDFRALKAQASMTHGRARSPDLSVSALGGFELRADGQRIELRSRKAQALLVYLLLNPMAAETRERLCGLLWSEHAEDKARASLRQVLHGLRELLEEHGFGGLSVDRESIRLTRGALSFDVSDALDRLGRHEVPGALASFEGLPDALLAGFEGIDGGFDVWLTIQRRLLREKMERSLVQCLDHGVGDTPLAAASALLNIDPSNEHACRRLMDLRAQQGDIAGALKAYKRLWDHLDADYDMEPSPETQALAVRLKSDPVPPAAPETGQRPEAPAPMLMRARAHPQRAVVVAPFDTSNLGPDYGYLATGLRQDLIGKLVRFREWVIIDGQHVQGAGSAELAARWPQQIWIDAFVAQAGNQMKITLAVREQPIANLIWSESFRFDLDNWFDIEREILSRVALTMNLHISTARLLASSGAPDVSMETYDLWLRGQSIIMNWRPERDRARALYRSILTEAPNFSPAHSSLAQLENSEHLALPGIFRTTEREVAGLEQSKIAVRLDPFDSRAHLALGWASAMNGLFDQSDAAFRTALELNENDPWTINSAALGRAYCGNVAQSVAAIERLPGLGLRPSAFHSAYQGAIHFIAGNYAAAVEAYEQSGDIIGDLGAWKSASLAHLGRLEEARRAADHFVEHVRSRWAAPEPPSEPRLVAWFLHCFPIRQSEIWENLREGLARAGLDVPPIAEIPRHP
jgi:DNA-binding SARP family transcriptional activator/TolB-like protein